MGGGADEDVSEIGGRKSKLMEMSVIDKKEVALNCLR